MTLGLTETWYDTSSKFAFNGLNVVAIKHRRATTAFFNATVAQVFEVLADALEKLIERNPEVKVVVTVSPVPMAQTFTNMDVFTANTYSKAVLRVAGQLLTARFPFVDSFPRSEARRLG